MQGTMFRRLSVQPSLTRALRAVPRHYAWRHQQSALHATAATSAPTAPTIPGKSVYTDLMRGNGTGLQLQHLVDLFSLRTSAM